MATAVRRRGLTLWHVVATLPWIVAVLVARSSIGDNSFLWHVTAGRVQIDAGAVITADPFSFTRLGDPWRTQSWLADVLYGWLDERWALGFVPALRWLMAVLLFVAVGLAVASIRQSTQVVGVVLFLTALLAVPYLNPRPVVFSYVLFGLLVLVEQRPRLRWALPPLFWLWASLHGSWVIGAGYLALRVLETKEWRRIAREAPVIGLVTMLTAHGWAVVDYLLAFADARDGLSLITEWGSPDLLSIPRLPFTAALLLLVVGAAMGRIPVRMVVFSLPLVLFALSSNRSVLPAFLLLVPAFATAFPAAPAFGRPLKGVAVAVAAIAVLPLVLPVDGGLEDDRFATELVAASEGRRLFHDDVIGGYLIYAEGPGRKVLVDDRAELYGPFLREFVDARSAREGWRDFFEEWSIEAAIVRRGQPLEELLVGEGWRPGGEQGANLLLFAPPA